MIPGNKRKGSPTGGGNFYIFKKATPAQQEAAFKFIKWVTQPERAAQWSMDTGYVAVSRGGLRAPTTLRKYGRDFPPALVARDQLPLSVAEFSTHDNQRVTKALNDGLQAALTGTKTPAQAMQDAQREADRILRTLQVTRATRSAAARAGSAAATRPSTPGCCCCRRWCCWWRSRTGRPSRPSIDSFYSTPKGSRPAVWVGAGELPGDGRRPGVLEGGDATTCGSPAPPSRCRSAWRW